MRTDCEALPASSPTGSRGSFSESRVARAMKPDSQLPPSVKVKNAWDYNYTPPYIFISWCLIRQTDNFTFILHFMLQLIGMQPSLEYTKYFKTIFVASILMFICYRHKSITGF
jgi:hypothetical protein